MCGVAHPRWRWLPLVLALAGGGCSSCDEEEALRVEGDAPYVRCFERAPPSEVAGAVVDMDARALRFEGLSDPVRLAVLAAEPGRPLPLEALEALRPSAVLVLGGYEPEGADALDVPVLALPGPGEPTVPAGAIDVSAFRTVRLGRAELVPLAGVPAGGYASAEAPCGFADDDTDAFELDPPGEGRYRLLVSWVAPPRPPASEGLLGVEAGDAIVGAVAQAAAATGVVFAWPDENVLRPLEDGTSRLALAVPRGSGPWHERADGSRVPSGPILIRLGPDGAAYSP